MELCMAVCARLQMSREDGAVVAEHLVDAELRGTIGLSRLLALAADGRRYGIETSGEIAVVREGPWGALLDGGNRNGIVVATRATRLAITKAAEGGIAAVAANHHRFSGLLARYVELAARQGLVAIAVAAGGVRAGLPRIAPYGSRVGLFTTNPIAVGVPTAGEPVVWDIATSSVSGAELLDRLADGAPLPDGAAVDTAGLPTRDPHEAIRGALLTWGGHRGSGLAVAVHLLGLLAGLPPFPGETDGAAFVIVALDPSLTGEATSFAQRAMSVAEQVRAAEPAAGHDEVRMPFDRSLRERARQRREGLQIPLALHDGLTAIVRDGIAA
jgi:delta1-piperideine-2-carboxylate reductase